MKTIKTVGIKNLKDNLSAYLRDVKAGALILITDRGNVVAELREPNVNNILTDESSLQSDWIRVGKIIPPRSRKKECLPTAVSSKKGTAINLLDEERDG